MVTATQTPHEAVSDDTLTAIAFDDSGGAVDALQARTKIEPTNVMAWCSLGIARARTGRYDLALFEFRRALELAPGHVVSTAYSGVCLYMLGRTSEAEDVLDYEGMIEVAQLLPAEKSDQLRIFNEELLAHVLSHPTLTWELHGKAIRGGYQSQELLTEVVPEVMRQFRQLLEAHLEQMYSDPAEAPLRWNLTAWAVSLHSGGHQLPHVHPRGLLSGVYYASIPTDLVGDAGALRFRRQLPWLPATEHSLSLKSHVVKPAAGTLVVFPSYFWHETVPFESEAARVSLAFDVFPPPIGS